MRIVGRIAIAAAGASMLAAGWRAGEHVQVPQPSAAAQGVVSTTTPMGAVAAGPASAAGASDGAGEGRPGRSAPAPSAAAPSTPAASPAAPSPPPAPSKDGTYVGPAVATRYGTVQVELTVAGEQVTDVQALALGGADPTSRRISSQAFPMLVERVVQAQSANVSYVSGASYTSDGVLTSVEGALADAGLA